MLEYAFEQRSFRYWPLDGRAVGPFVLRGLRRTRRQVIGEVLVLHHVDEDGKDLELCLRAPWDPLVARNGGDEVYLNHVDTRMQYGVKSPFLWNHTMMRIHVRSKWCLIRQNPQVVLASIYGVGQVRRDGYPLVACG